MKIPSSTYDKIRLTKLSFTMRYTFFRIFYDTSWILPETHDPSLCDTLDNTLCSEVLTKFGGSMAFLILSCPCMTFDLIIHYVLVRCSSNQC